VPAVVMHEHLGGSIRSWIRHPRGWKVKGRLRTSPSRKCAMKGGHGGGGVLAAPPSVANSGSLVRDVTGRASEAEDQLYSPFDRQ